MSPAPFLSSPEAWDGGPTRLELPLQYLKLVLYNVAYLREAPGGTEPFADVLFCGPDGGPPTSPGSAPSRELFPTRVPKTDERVGGEKSRPRLPPPSPWVLASVGATPDVRAGAGTHAQGRGRPGPGAGLPAQGRDPAGISPAYWSSC